jgi:hypothetical protein
VGIDPALPGSPLCKAVLYSLTRWGMLTAYAETGDWPIDNNPAVATCKGQEWGMYVS